jgi:hypothetical protein
MDERVSKGRIGLYLGKEIGSPSITHPELQKSVSGTQASKRPPELHVGEDRQIERRRDDMNIEKRSSHVGYVGFRYHLVEAGIVHLNLRRGYP